MAAGGMTQTTIAARMGMTDKTLREHFREELDFGLSEINTLAIGQLVQKIKQGEAWAICFWLKTRAGWREVERIEHVGEDGGPVKIIVEYEDRPAKTPAPASGPSTDPREPETV